MRGQAFPATLGDEGEADLPEAAQRILSSRRRELEREFDVKRADLKAQHSRRMALLEQEKQDWLEARRQQAKELADKTEKVRRRVQNQEQRAELGAAEKRELEERRAQVKAFEQAERQWARERKTLESELDGTRRALRSTSARARWGGVALLLGLLTWILAGRGGAVALGGLAAGVAASLMLGFSRARTPRK